MKNTEYWAWMKSTDALHKSHGPFASKEEAIENASIDIKDGDKILVGPITWPDPIDFFPSKEWFLEVTNDAVDDDGWRTGRQGKAFVPSHEHPEGLTYTSVYNKFMNELKLCLAIKHWTLWPKDCVTIQKAKQTNISGIVEINEEDS